MPTSFKIVPFLTVLIWSCAASAQSVVDIQQIVNTMVRLCLGGGHTQAASGGGTGNADISLRSLDVKGNLQGEFKINQSSAEGLVNGIDNALTQVAADQADKVRACLQPVRERLLDVFLPLFPPPVVQKPPATDASTSPDSITRVLFFCAASNKDGCPETNIVCVSPDIGDEFETKDVHLQTIPVHDATGWVLSKESDKVCVRADASVDGQGRNSRVNAKLSIREKLRPGAAHAPTSEFPESVGAFSNLH